MKRIVLASLLAALHAGAANAETLWVGDAFVTSSTCGAVQIGDNYRAVYRPAGAVLDNPGGSHLAFFGGRAAVTVKTAAGQFSPGAAITTFGASSRATEFVNEPGSIFAWTRSPAAVGAGTRNIYIETTITNFFGTSTCTVGLRLNLIKEPAVP